MAGESKGTEVASLGAEWGGRDGRRWQEMVVAQSSSDEVRVRG
jgi:hypothetical protein